MKNKKAISYKDVLSSYILSVVTMLISVVCWFLPTTKMTYFMENSMFSNEPEEIIIYFFSFKESTPIGAGILNVVFLLFSIASIVIMLIPLISKKTMLPNSKLIIPAICYLLYFIVFLIRGMAAIKNNSLYEINVTPIWIIYGFSLAISFGGSISLFGYRNRLKEQLMQESSAD